MDAAKTTINQNSIGIHIFGIGASVQVTGIKQVFGLLRKGTHKAASKIAAKTK